MNKLKYSWLIGRLMSKSLLTLRHYIVKTNEDADTSTYTSVTACVLGLDEESQKVFLTVSNCFGMDGTDKLQP